MSESLPAPALARPTDRLVASLDLDAVIRATVAWFHVGELQSYSEITVGYEDCNVIVVTSTGKYVAKLFAARRTAADVERYVSIMRQVAQAGVQHPALIAGEGGAMTLLYDSVWVALAPFVNGKTYYDLQRAPTASERHAILAEVAKINAIEHRLPSILGSWPVSKFYDMSEQVRSHMSAGEQAMIQSVAACYDRLPFERFERAFIHCDLRTTNVLVGDDGLIYVLDYFLANHHWRVQEVAVMIATLFYDPAQSVSFDELCRMVADDYGKLTDHDRSYLLDFTRVVVAMEFIGGTYARYVQGDTTDENNYWRERGGRGLEQFYSSL